MLEPYTVVVVEDELLALKHICTIIQERCPGFRVVARCEDGTTGLQAVEELLPDLVITDIKMPGLSGVDLVSTVHDRFPLIFTLVVSGYQDFQYVKGALTAGSTDYLLKPVAPENLRTVLSRIEPRIEEARGQHRSALVHSFLLETPVAPDLLRRHFPDSGYFCAVVRDNALPRRFNRIPRSATGKNNRDSTTFSGRDAQELLFLWPQSRAGSYHKFRTLVEHEVRSHREDSSVFFTTAVISERSHEASQLKAAVRHLYRTLDANVIIGHSRIITDSHRSPQEAEELSPEEYSSTRIGYLLTENKFQEFQEEITTLFDRWEQKRFTQLHVEHHVHQIYGWLLHHAKHAYQAGIYEILLDDAFAGATSYEELRVRIMEIFQQIVASEYGTFRKIDTPEFFGSVVSYIQKNFRDSIVLPDLCSMFGISQTYMSRLFRKYTGCSFTRYLNLVRINSAKEIMRENRNLIIKDVAAMVGYRDQFYFSKQFRAVTGMTPSAFIRQERPHEHQPGDYPSRSSSQSSSDKRYK